MMPELHVFHLRCHGGHAYTLTETPGELIVLPDCPVCGAGYERIERITQRKGCGC